MNGFLNIYKPKGMTSFDVVARLRRVTKIKQIGHTGTLDPFAVGVLPICIGKSTRLIEYLDDDFLKTAYQFGNGIRILRQDLWEMIISFIIEQRNYFFFNVFFMKFLIDSYID